MGWICEVIILCVWCCCVDGFGKWDTFCRGERTQSPQRPRAERVPGWHWAERIPGAPWCRSTRQRGHRGMAREVILPKTDLRSNCRDLSALCTQTVLFRFLPPLGVPMPTQGQLWGSVCRAKRAPRFGSRFGATLSGKRWEHR